MTLLLTPEQTPEDQPYFKALFFEQMQERMPGVPEEQFNLLADMQYRARQSAYNQNWPEAVTYLVSDANEKLGLVMLDHFGNTLHIVDLLVAREHRGQGIGQKILEEVITLADQEQQDITLSLAVGNPVLRLYERLGFEVLSQNDTQIEMRRSRQCVE